MAIWDDGQIHFSLSYVSSIINSENQASAWFKDLLPTMLTKLGETDVASLVTGAQPSNPAGEGDRGEQGETLCDMAIVSLLLEYASGTVTIDEVLAVVPEGNRDAARDYAEVIRQRVEADPSLLDPSSEGPFGSGDLLPSLCAD